MEKRKRKEKKKIKNGKKDKENHNAKKIDCKTVDNKQKAAERNKNKKNEEKCPTYSLFIYVIYVFVNLLICSVKLVCNQFVSR